MERRPNLFDSKGADAEAAGYKLPHHQKRPGKDTPAAMWGSRSIVLSETSSTSTTHSHSDMASVVIGIQPQAGANTLASWKDQQVLPALKRAPLFP